MANVSEQMISIAITCTDKGQHSSTSLGDLSILFPGEENGLLWANAARNIHGVIAETRRHECVWIDLLDVAPLRANMRCPRCGRHVQWQHAKAMDKLRRLHEAGVSTVDISHLR